VQTRMQHQVEIVGDTATLYITGTLGLEHGEALACVCDAFPSGVRTLRLDLQGLGQLSAEATSAVRLLLRHWRDARHGEFRLTTTHMLATLREVASPVTASLLEWRRPALNDALAATYL
jgi:ABC-type transporter Mla MlaB component